MTQRTCQTARQGAHEHINILDRQRFYGEVSRIQTEQQMSKVNKRHQSTSAKQGRLQHEGRGKGSRGPSGGWGVKIQRCSPKCKHKRMCTPSCDNAAVESTIYTFLLNIKYKAAPGMKSKMKNRFSCRCCRTGSTTTPAAVSRRQESKGLSELQVGRGHAAKARHTLSFSQQPLHSTTCNCLCVQRLGAIYAERQVAPDPRQVEGQTHPELLPSKGRVHHLQLALWQRQAVVPHQPHGQGLLAPGKPVQHLILHHHSSISLASITSVHAQERQDLTIMCPAHHE